MQKIFLLFLLIFLGNTSIPASSQDKFSNDILTLQVQIIGVKDGDTVEGLYYKLPIVIRLEHIDAPEKKQAFGAVSKQKLFTLAFGKTVTLVSTGKKGNYDRNGRLIAALYLNEKTCLNKEMLIAGLAWHYKKYSTNAEYAHLENAARKNKVGLWAEKAPVAPWNFRK